MSRSGLAAAPAVAAALLAAAPAHAITLSAPPLRVEIDDASGRIEVRQAGRALLREDARTGTGATGRLGFRVGGRWYRARRVVARGEGNVQLATTDPAGRRIVLSLAADGRGAARLRASVTNGSTAGVEAIGLAAAAARGERYLGFGERSDRVDQRGREVQNFVAEGPYPASDYPAVLGSRSRPGACAGAPTPPTSRCRGCCRRAATACSWTTRWRAASCWAATAATPGASRSTGTAMSLRVLGGPSVAAVLQRLGAHRPPAAAEGPVAARPLVPDRARQRGPRRAGLRAAPARRRRAGLGRETHMRYMPCGADRGRERPSARGPRRSTPRAWPR